MRGGFQQITINSGQTLQWSSGWESVFKTLIPTAEPLENNIDDSQWWKRLKMKVFYERYLLAFELQRNSLGQPNLKLDISTVVRCVCGHSHTYQAPCVTCDNYKETSIKLYFLL